MWIRSQCKQDIVSTNAVWCADSFILKDGNYIVCMSGGIKFLLGEYSTKEKALKVLDKIVEQMEFCTETRTSIKPYSRESYWDTRERVATVVFKMPQDDEVIVDG